MMVNYMKEVAKLFGVEEEEVFQIDNDTSLENNIFKFADGFLQMSEKDEDDHIWWVAGDGILIRLLRGTLSIRKPLWKPAMGEKYYIPGISCGDLYILHKWNNEYFDDVVHERGLTCKTKEEAVLLAKKMLAAIND